MLLIVKMQCYCYVCVVATPWKNGMEVCGYCHALYTKVGRTSENTRERWEIHEERLPNLNAMFLSC